MEKSIYSLVLNDEIVEMIDNVAYKRGVSRSTLINGILADYVGYVTPQKRLQSMFSIIDSLVMAENRMRLDQQKNDSGFCIISALNYKYSPRITYAVELSGSADEIGYLTIGYRTSNQELVETIANFFIHFIEIEQERVDAVYDVSVRDGKIRRLLRIVDTKDSEEIANRITSYVSALDKLLNVYIQDDFDRRDENLKNNYAKLMISRI